MVEWSEKMTDQKSLCIDRIRNQMSQLSNIRDSYLGRRDKTDTVLLHFIQRTEEIVTSSLLSAGLPTVLMILCRVLCEDLFLIYWIAQSTEAAEEYEEGVQNEMAKMLGVSLSNGWGVIRNIHTGEVVSKEFMEQEFWPKLKALRAPRTRIEQIAQRLGLQKLYDTLYRAASLEVHGNTFGLPEPRGGDADYIALSSIDALLNCILAIVALPRKILEPKEILSRLRIEKMGLKT
jgi:hypothetical protein